MHIHLKKCAQSLTSCNALAGSVQPVQADGCYCFFFSCFPIRSWPIAYSVPGLSMASLPSFHCRTGSQPCHFSPGLSVWTPTKKLKLVKNSSSSWSLRPPPSITSHLLHQLQPITDQMTHKILLLTYKATPPTLWPSSSYDSRLLTAPPGGWQYITAVEFFNTIGKG